MDALALHAMPCRYFSKTDAHLCLGKWDVCLYGEWADVRGPSL